MFSLSITPRICGDTSFCKVHQLVFASRKHIIVIFVSIDTTVPLSLLCSTVSCLTARPRRDFTMDHAKRGADALNAKSYPEAIKAYTAAIEVSPTSPEYHIQRSTAYQRSTPSDFPSALSDAETAVVLAQKRAKRESIIRAQMRRAVALYGLERYADAGFVLDIVKKMDPKEKTLAIWENKINAKLGGLGEADIKAQITVKETPDKQIPEPANKTVMQEKSKPEKAVEALTTKSSASLLAPIVAQTPANKIRHDWYQNSDNVYFTLLAKGVPKDKAVIDIQERSLSISFPLIDSSYEFTLDPLFAPVDSSKSTKSILSTKVEIVLKKTQSGQKWHALESSEPITATPSEPTSTVPSHVLQSSNTAVGPSYPTSSRSGPKDWDKLATDLIKQHKKPKTEGSSSTEDDENMSDEESDAVNGFFKKLYKGANPDAQKAMMKSFTESNGTALSTDWGEVSKGPVKTVPPDGMTARKYEQ